MKFYMVKEEGNILHTVKTRKTNWIDDVLRRNCLLKRIIEGNIGRSEGKTRKKAYAATG